MPKTYKTSSSSDLQAKISGKAGDFVNRSGSNSRSAACLTQVSGGWIKRDISSGRLIEASSDQGVSKASATSHASVREASGKRSAALKRLADR